MSKASVIFDFDGVIADSFGAVFKVVEVACASGVSEEDYRDAYNRNIYAWANDPLLHTEACKHELFEELLPSYVESMAQLFAGMDRSLEKLASKYELHVVTSNSRQVAETFLAKHFLRDFFVRILGREVSKSKITKLQQLRAEHGVERSNSLYVTDTVGDILEVREAGYQSLAVTWGYCSLEALAGTNPVGLVHVPADIPEAVEKYFFIN